MDVTAQLLPCIQLIDIQFKLGLIHKGIRNEIIICIYLFNLIFIRKKKKKLKNVSLAIYNKEKCYYLKLAAILASVLFTFTEQAEIRLKE